MPKYEVTDNATGKRYELEGDSPPTEQELEGIFAGQRADAGPQLKQDHPVKRTISNIARPTLEALGMVGGGILGSGAAPVAGTVAGAGLGYAGGASLADLLDTYLLGIDRRQSLPQTLKRTAKDIGTGALTEMGGQVAGKALAGGLNKFMAPKAAPNLAQRQDISALLKEQGGAGLTPAELTQRRGLQLIESSLDKDVAATNVMNKYRQQNVDAANRLKDMVMKNAGGGGLSKEAAGIETQKIAEKNAQAFKELSDDAYAQVEKYIPKGEPIPTPTVDKVSRDIAEDLAQSRLARGDMEAVAGKLTEPPGVFRQGIPDKVRIAEQMETVAGISGKPVDVLTKKVTVKPGTPTEWKPFQDVTWNGLNMDRKWLTSEINKAWKAGDNFKASTYGKLKDAIDADISAYSESIGGEAKEAFDWANQLFRAGADVYRDKKILGNVIRNSTPEKITDLFLKPNNVTNVKLLKSAVGDEGLQPIKQVWLEGLVSKGEEQSFSLAKFANAWDKYDKNTLLSFLKPQEFSDLSQLAKISRVLGEVEKQAGNPSGTARVGNVIATGWALTTHPVITAVRLAGANKFAKLYLHNPSFKKYVVEGARLPVGSDKAVDYATKLMTISALDDRENNQEALR